MTEGSTILRYSWLSCNVFESIEEVQDYATQWLWFYNHERPNKANGGLPPKLMLVRAHDFYFGAQLEMGHYLTEQTRLNMVARDGIEPPTRGFSIPCSTN